MAASRQSRQQFVRGTLIAAGVCAALVLLLTPTRAFRWLESGAYDARARFTAYRTPPDRRIVIIDIDNTSFDTLKDNFGRWPWHRNVWTESVRYLARGAPRAIIFDSVFSGQDTPENDAAYAQVMQQAGNVILGYTFSPGEIDTADTAERPRKLALLARDSLPAASAAVGEDLKAGAYALNTPAAGLAGAAAGLGSITGTIDPDGVTRRVALAYRYGDRLYPSLAVRAADFVALSPQAQPQPFLRAGRFAEHAGARVPVDGDGRLLLVWHGDSAAYERIPIWQLLSSAFPASFVEHKVFFPPEYFKGKIVLIGASATGSYEVRPTPLDETAPGFISHANALDDLLHHDGMAVAPGWFPPLAVVLLAFGGAALMIWIASAAWSTAAFAALLAAYSGMTYLVFWRGHLWLPLAAPAVALIMSFASAGGVRYATTGRELRRTRGTLDRYMSPQLVQYVLEHIDGINFAGSKRELTIFFSDVRNFTTLTEKSDPLVLIAMLNEYLTEMTEAIFKYNGVVDKFIGDGILAYWGAFDAPGARSNHALLAAQASLEMFERLRALNARWITEGRPAIDIGIGLNTGEVIFGNVGAGKKIEFTVIGDPVNLAARLESLNKEYKCHIIISEFTLARIADFAEVRPLGGVKVKGKTIETSIFELTGLKSAPGGARGAAPPQPGTPG